MRIKCNYKDIFRVPRDPVSETGKYYITLDPLLYGVSFCAIARICVACDFNSTIEMLVRGSVNRG